MITDANSLLDKLNSPSDWAFVLGAGVVGFVLDGAINIIPIPFFSSGICALTAASATLALKRGAEAAAFDRRKGRRRKILTRQVERYIREFRNDGQEGAAEDLTL